MSALRRYGLAFSGVAAAAALVAGSGCMETRRAVGEECLKDQDCLSGICAQLVCASAPVVTDAQPVLEAAPAADAGSD